MDLEPQAEAAGKILIESMVGVTAYQESCNGYPLESEGRLAASNRRLTDVRRSLGDVRTQGEIHGVRVGRESMSRPRSAEHRCNPLPAEIGLVSVNNFSGLALKKGEIAISHVLSRPRLTGDEK